MKDVIIETESPEDRDAIAAVVRRAFEHPPAVADMVAPIRRSPRYRPGLAVVAHLASEPVGFMMLSGTDLVDQNGDRREVLTLTPLAVTPGHQRRGIGSAWFVPRYTQLSVLVSHWSFWKAALGSTAGSIFASPGITASPSTCRTGRLVRLPRFSF